MYILSFDFFEKDDKYVFKTRNSCCVKGVLAFNTNLSFFLNKSDDYLHFYITILENSRLKSVFGTQNTFVFVLAGRGY